MENFELYLIRCITNLHVGDGNTSYGIIDNEVQKDVITKYPIINSSSLKGSLRNYLESRYSKNDVNEIFGDETKMGLYRVFPGMLLSIPMRSDNRPYYNVTCFGIMKEFLGFLDLLDIPLKLSNDYTNEKNSKSKVNIEGEDVYCQEVNNDDMKKLFYENLIIIDDKKFGDFVKELPIIARNKLENGESKNLWYEEVVPRETRFYFGLCRDGNKKLLFNSITENLVQIGGNATIGYGYCNITKLK
ncbi:CRISPR-associated protein, Cmr4 family [Clostridium sp. DSM 8431]|uniref:type III-B CRISPR module RAMP protein Cmr4 n=1 Tax=Clostridium sp. DSM 8431 TaxID=1761781 RepID=UPI0008EDFDD2|nr:type III-B CRISPR module RAMP protein Cmr4 [Clostridium sp. DSM 8431]SFU71101.1 CRISPR-associated protein, Cmr4 family [Clostridium sp. DSM 8431]